MEIQLAEKPVFQTKDSVESGLEFRDPKAPIVIDQVDPEIAKQADEIVDRLLAIDPTDEKAKQNYSKAVRNLGFPAQEKLTKQSEILKTPMATLMRDAEDGGATAVALLDLQSKVSEINPNKVNFNMSGFRKLLSKLPGIGTPLSKWVARYQAVDGVIEDIIASLKDGKAQLERDNTTLADDQLRMRELTHELENYIQLAQVLDQKLSSAIEAKGVDDPNRAFFEEELLFPLRQRIIDLQTQLAVNQQGVLATEVIVRNNRELTKGVERAISTTVTALNTAATLQIALQHQKKVLEGVQAVTDTTNELILGTSEQLKDQGAAIQKQAAEATLDISVLKQSFENVETALQDISAFRREALPGMANSVLEMDSLTTKMEESISKMERGNEVVEDFVFVASSN